MTYSLDLRMRVVAHARKTRRPCATAKLFNVSRTTLRGWLKLDDLTPKRLPQTRRRKIDRVLLEKSVLLDPHKTIKQRANEFNVAPSSMSAALKKARITHKKNQLSVY